MRKAVQTWELLAGCSLSILEDEWCLARMPPLPTPLISCQCPAPSCLGDFVHVLPFKKIFLYLAKPSLSCSIQTLSCGMWNPVS